MAEAIVKLRAIYLSGDFDSYWSFHIANDRQRLYPAESLNEALRRSERSASCPAGSCAADQIDGNPLRKKIRPYAFSHLALDRRPARFPVNLL